MILALDNVTPPDTCSGMQCDHWLYLGTRLGPHGRVPVVARCKWSAGHPASGDGVFHFHSAEPPRESDPKPVWTDNHHMDFRCASGKWSDIVMAVQQLRTCDRCGTPFTPEEVEQFEGDIAFIEVSGLAVYHAQGAEGDAEYRSVNIEDCCSKCRGTVINALGTLLGLSKAGVDNPWATTRKTKADKPAKSGKAKK